MSLPYVPARERIAPDDVQSAEIVGDVFRAADDAVDLFAREHLTSGRERGKHDLVTIPTAVARFRIWPSGFTFGGGQPPLESGDGSLLWAYGFEEPPRLIVGAVSVMPEMSGVWLRWRISDTRATSDRGIVQLIHSTTARNDFKPGVKPWSRAVGQDGALRLGFDFSSDTDGPGVDPGILAVEEVTIAVYLLLNR